MPTDLLKTIVFARYLTLRQVRGAEIGSVTRTPIVKARRDSSCIT